MLKLSWVVVAVLTLGVSGGARAYDTSVGGSNDDMTRDKGISSEGGTEYRSGMDSNKLPKTGYSATRLPPDACAALVKATPDANVAYQPGMDAQGKKVVPADIGGGSQIQLPQQIQIPLTLSLAKVINLDTTKYPYNQLGPSTEPILGTLTVEGDRVSFNGKPLSDQQQDNLSVLCLKQTH